ncbi:MAG: hypothetical protein SVO01_06270 [Thermotogota bacterium]|nr:hypothetical protein [Thermotogota bacterium]
MDITDAAIASPHWEACNTCKFHGDNGCIKSFVKLSVYLGDWIICNDYDNTKKFSGQKAAD